MTGWLAGWRGTPAIPTMPPFVRLTPPDPFQHHAHTHTPLHHMLTHTHIHQHTGEQEGHGAGFEQVPGQGRPRALPGGAGRWVGLWVCGVVDCVVFWVEVCACVRRIVGRFTVVGVACIICVPLAGCSHPSSPPTHIHNTKQPNPQTEKKTQRAAC